MLDTYQQELVLNNSNLVYKIAHKFFGTDREDLVQQGFLGLCMAAERYDLTKGIEFSTYAYKYIYTMCLSCQQKDSNMKPKRVGTKMVKVTTISLDACTTEPADIELDNNINVKYLIRDLSLNKLERTLLYGCAIGYTRKEIFDRLGISRADSIIVIKRLSEKIKRIREE